MKRNYFNEVKNILRKYDNSTTHRIFYGYTLFNVAHFALLFVFLLAFHDVIHSLNRGKLLEISNEFITPVTILLGFVIGFLQFAKTHVRLKYVHARILASNMFLGFAWLYMVQIVVIKIMSNLIMDGDIAAHPFSFARLTFTISKLSATEMILVMLLVFNVMIVSTIIFVAYDKMLKPTVHKGLAIVVLNTASVSFFIICLILADCLFVHADSDTLLNYIIIVLFLSSLAYIMFAVTCICMALLAAASRIGSGFLDLQDKTENLGDRVKYNESGKLFDDSMIEILNRDMDNLPNVVWNKIGSFSSSITMIEGEIDRTRNWLWRALKETRLALEKDNRDLCNVFTIYFSTDMPAHILVNEMNKSSVRPPLENFVVIDCFNDYAGFGEIPSLKNSPIKVFYSDSESMLTMHMCLRSAYVYMEESEKMRTDWYVVIVIDSLTSLLNITPYDDLIKLFYHMSWCRKNDAVKWCLSNVIALVDRAEIKYNADGLANYYKILNITKNRINLYNYKTDYDQQLQQNEQPEKTGPMEAAKDK